jgi:hypothetical protein
MPVALHPCGALIFENCSEFGFEHPVADEPTRQGFSTLSSPCLAAAGYDHRQQRHGKPCCFTTHSAFMAIPDGSRVLVEGRRGFRSAFVV